MAAVTRLAAPDESRSSRQRSDVFLGAWSIVAAFGTYFCMYGLRKPFTVAAFDDVTFLGAGFKTILVTSQVAGYMTSKFIGIKVVSEMPPRRRAAGILALVAFAEVALVLFGLVPPPWNALCLFLNGLPLGMVFGLVLSFLEGRRSTEALTAGLCASFILADGVVKSAGSWLLARNVSEYWMPSLAGAIFLMPLVVCVAMLARIPSPTKQDQDARTERGPMSRQERWSLFGRYAFGLTLLVTMYLAITIVRSIRADFAPEIWQGFGVSKQPEIFTQSEMWVALGVTLVNGCLVCIGNSRAAFFTSLAVCLVGLGLLVAALVSLQQGAFGGFPFMVCVGLGMYLPYVAMHTTVFERLLAMTRDRGTIGFLMYVADSIGYLGYVGVMLTRNFTQVAGDFVSFFTTICWIAASVAGICILMSWRYFAVRCPASTASPSPEVST